MIGVVLDTTTAIYQALFISSASSSGVTLIGERPNRVNANMKATRSIPARLAASPVETQAKFV